MRSFKTATCFLLISICIQYAYAQHAALKDPQFIATDSGLIINHFYKYDCKDYIVRSGFIALQSKIKTVPDLVKSIKTGSAFITVHGNISYDFYYRSQIDTPFKQQDLQQHTERVWLEVMFKGKYPFRVGFTARQSNSPFFKDLATANFNFDRYAYNKNIKQGLINKLNAVKWDNPDLKRLDSLIKLKTINSMALKNWLNSPEILQRLIEEKEKLFYSKQRSFSKNGDSNAVKIPAFQTIKLSNGRTLTFKKDSVFNVDNKLPGFKIDTSFTKNVQAKKAELDSLFNVIAKLRHQSDSIRNSISKNILQVKQAIYKASNPKELEIIAKQNNINDPHKETMQKFLDNVKTLNIGRSLVDYTELTAQNILVTGINVEYNPSYYAAVAAGSIDYGFRDFLGRTTKQKNQYLLLGRLGWGDKDKSTVIITLFNGRKNNYPGLLAADSSNNTAQLFGYSIETIIKKNSNTFFSVEIAKSTKSTINSAANKENNLFKYSDNSNMGINVKGQTAITETATRLSGFYRKTGEAFQSFSLFTYNTNQQAWQVRADQPLLKNKVNVTAMLRQNDFTNPLTDKTFKTTTVFKTLQLSVRIPHWPSFSAGYYPGSQVYIAGNNTVRENVYYILNGAVLHNYTYKGIVMNSSFIYNRYFNKATDSGFVLYKGINYIISQSLQLKKLQLQSGYAYNKQTELSYYTLDENADYTCNKILRVGAGLKYNHVLAGTNYWGETVKLSADLKRLGQLQLQYEKSYLPTLQQTLYPVEIGRVSWYKSF